MQPTGTDPKEPEAPEVTDPQEPEAPADPESKEAEKTEDPESKEAEKPEDQESKDAENLEDKTPDIPEFPDDKSADTKEAQTPEDTKNPETPEGKTPDTLETPEGHTTETLEGQNPEDKSADNPEGQDPAEPTEPVSGEPEILTGQNTLSAEPAGTAAASISFDETAQIPVGAYFTMSETVPTDLQVQPVKSLSPKKLLSAPLKGSSLAGTSGSASGTPGSLALSRSFDLTLNDADGNPIQPAEGSKVQLSITMPEIADKSLYVRVYHHRETESGTERELLPLLSREGSTITTETTGFSTFTVEFYYGDNVYVMEGGTTIFLSELIKALEIKEFTITDVTSVSFLDPSLIEVDEVVIAPQDYAEFSEESEDQTDETIQPAAANTDWRLVSLAPFTTNESITIVLASGEDFVIPVTDDTVAGTRVNNTRVTADKVTYNIANAGTADGWARVYAYADGCTIHNAISYNGHTYTVDYASVGAGANNYTRFPGGVGMDSELIDRAAGYVLQLPQLKTDVDQATKAAWEADGFVAGENNDTSDYKIWEKAAYNSSTNSIDYTIRYFQAMKEKVPLDFIFIYDDSISMYDQRWAPDNTAANRQVRIVEAQGTRIMILETAKALLSEAAKNSYDIQVAVGGASDGDTRRSNWYKPGEYEGLQKYLSVYHTGVTDHTVGAENAYQLAKSSADNGRIPVVIYLSDFADGGSRAAFRGEIASKADYIRSVGSTYALKTIGTTSNFRSDTIAGSADNIYFMNEISSGVEQLDKIVKDAIGFYMKDAVTISDSLSGALSGLTPTAAVISPAAGSAAQSAGSSTWSLGGSAPYLSAGVVYEERFSVPLDNDKVYAGTLPALAAAAITVNGVQVNTITPAMGTDPAHLHYAQPLTFVLGELDKKGRVQAYNATGLPMEPVEGISFTIQEAELSAGTYIGKDGAQVYSASTGNDGTFSIPFTVTEGNATRTILENGKTYLLTEGSVTAYNDSADANSKNQLIQPQVGWVITVDSDGVVSCAVNGAAGQAPDITMAPAGSGSSSRFVIWNQIVVNAMLIPVTVQKTWESGSYRPAVPFTVYGVSAGTSYPLQAYSSNDVKSSLVMSLDPASDSMCNESTVDGKTVWTRTVYVPTSIEENGSTIEFYTEDELTRASFENVDAASLKVDGEVKTVDWIINNLGEGEGTERSVKVNQTYSYEIKEDPLYNEEGWYTAKYTDTKNGAVSNQNYIGSWTAEQQSNEGWETYTGAVSTDFQFRLNAYDLYYYGADKSQFANDFKVLDVGNYARINTRTRAVNFYTNIKTLTLTITDTNNSKRYLLTVNPGSSFTPSTWPVYNSHGGIIITGLRVPDAWENYATTKYGARDQKKVTGLRIDNITVTSKNNNSYQLYPVGQSNGRNNIFTYGPDYANLDRTTQISRHGGIYYNNTSSYCSTTAASYPSSIVAVQEYVYHTAVPSVENHRWIKRSCTLGIDNTWVVNKLIPLNIEKNWVNSEGGSIPNTQKKSSISFDLNGVDNNGVKKPIKVYSVSIHGWDDDYLAAGKGQPVVFSSSDTEATVTDSKWNRTYYVPMYDMSAYHYTTEGILDFDEFSEYCMDETPLQAVPEDGKDGVPGIWSSSNTVYTPGDEYTVGGGRTDTWDPVTLETSGTRYNHFYIKPKTGTTIQDVTQIVVKFDYKVSNTESKEFWFTLNLPKALDLYGTIPYNSGNADWGNGSSLSNTYAYNFEFHGLEALRSGDVISVNEVLIKTNGSLVDYTDKFNLNTSNVNYSKDGEIAFSRGVTNSTNRFRIENGSGSVTVKARSTEIEEEQTIVIPDSLSITNTYMPNRLLTLISIFTDGSKDRQSTEKVKTAHYSITGAGNSYTLNVPITSITRDASTSVTGSYGIYLPPKDLTDPNNPVTAEYTVSQTGYTLEGGILVDLSKVDNPYKTAIIDTNTSQVVSNPVEMSADREITFTNERKLLPVIVQSEWEPQLQSGEDPIAESGSAVSYTISYYNVFSGQNTENSTGAYKQTEPSVSPVPVDKDGTYQLSKAEHINKHSGIPTYSVNGIQTDCTIPGATLKAVLPDYETDIKTEVKDVDGVSSLVFTLLASVKRAPVNIDKRWDIAGELDNVIVKYIITRSDDKEIYGTNSKSVVLTMTKAANRDDDYDSLWHGTFKLVTEDDTIAENASGQIICKTDGSNLGSGLNTGDVLYLPVIRRTEKDNGVKYIVTEKVLVNGAAKSYYPVFADSENNTDNLFEQTNPRGRNEYLAGDDTSDGPANTARFRLLPAGITITVSNAEDPFICKIFDGKEHPFRTLNAALAYAREYLDGKATIEMLVDYVIPYADYLELGSNTVNGEDVIDDITLTTADTTGWVFNFIPTFTAADGRITADILDAENNVVKPKDDADKAILQRGWESINALFIVGNKDARFTTKNIIIDGYSRPDGETAATQRAGRAFYMRPSGGTLTIGDGTLVRRFNDRNGGAVQITASAENGSLRIENAAFQDCFATGDLPGQNKGGAIFLNKNASASETGMRIIGHTPGGLDINTPNALDGGAIYLRDNASFTFNRGIIEGCTASGRGGGICADEGAVVTFKGGEITDCTAGSFGGGIYADGTVIMKEDGTDPSDFERGTIEGCSAQNGGGIYVATGTFDMDGGAVEDCSASQDGGGIYVADGIFKLEDDDTHPGIINNCHADRNGGGIYVGPNTSTSKVTITGGFIQDCYADQYGGAIYDRTTGKFTVKGVTINGHVNLPASTKNAVDGGAIYMEYGTLEIGGPDDDDKVTIKNCTVSRSGAAIKDGTAAGVPAKLYFINSTITDCAADNVDGGAVNVGKASKIYFEGDTVIYNNPSSALGVQHKNVVLELDTANVNNNGVINTTEKGLGSKAKIGIYVVGSADDPQTEPYKSHGQAGQPFGVWSQTWTVNGSATVGEPPIAVTEGTTGAEQAGKNNLSKFVNDRNDLTGTLGSDGNANYIVWQITVKLYEGEVFHDFKDCLHPAISQDSAYTVRFQAEGKAENLTNGANPPKLKFTRQVTTNNGGTPVVNYLDTALPVGTTIIMRVNDGEYYHTKLASAASSVAFTEFKKMGDGSASTFDTGSINITNGSYTAQFIIDFSGVAGGMPIPSGDQILKLYTGLAYGSAEPDHNHNAEIDLLPKAVFEIAESTADNDLSETVNVKTGVVKDTQHQNDPWYMKPSVVLSGEYGRASIWDNRDMALVLKAHKADPAVQGDKDTVLPADAKLKVKVAGAEKLDCTQIIAGGEVMFIIPLEGPEFDNAAEMNAGRNVQLDLVSEHFPSSDADYKFDAELMVANSDHELSPLNGMYNAEAGKAAASGTVIFKHVGGTTDPSLKIKSTIKNAAAGTQDTHCYGPEQNVAFTVSELNVPDGCEVVAEMFKKNNSTGSWAAQSANKLTSVAANPAAGDFANPLTIKAAADAVPAGKEWKFYFTTEAQAANAAMDDSYKLVVKVVKPAVADDPSTPENEAKAAETLREVPYYFLVVGK